MTNDSNPRQIINLAADDIYNAIEKLNNAQREPMPATIREALENATQALKRTETELIIALTEF